jgi:pilus assembly protein CpaD
MIKEAIMNRSAKLFRACTALATVLLAACASPINGAEDAVSITDRFPITVEPQMEGLRLPYDAARADIDEAGSAELQRFARDYLENGSGTIGVSAPTRALGVIGSVTDRLLALGVPRDRITIGGDSAPNDNAVRLTYIRYRAQTVPCGDWSTNLGYTSANKPSPNLGCATQHNLAAMVADPRDLVTPQPMEAGDAQRRLTVLEKYRKGEATLAEKTQEQSGVVSNIAASGGK